MFLQIIQKSFFCAIFASTFVLTSVFSYDEIPCFKEFGNCIEISSCRNQSNIRNRLCPTQRANVKCCIPYQEDSCASLGGECQRIEKTCDGIFQSQKCPTQPANVKCCVKKTKRNETIPLPSSNLAPKAEKPSEKDCNDIDFCSHCVRQSSWWGEHCRWCPFDNKCHAAGAILSNPCKTEQNVESASSCSAPVAYNPNLSYQLFQHAALAYSDAPYNCLQAHDPSNGREVKKTFLSKCDFADNKCFAYMAIDKRANAIILAFRGTFDYKNASLNQLLVESLQILTPKLPVNIGGAAEAYFKNAFDTLWPFINLALSEQLKKMPNAKLWITGHSLGGALASLASSEIAFAYNTIIKRSNIFLYTFGQPRVGNYYYARAHDLLVPHSYRVINENDIVPHLPGCGPQSAVEMAALFASISQPETIPGAAVVASAAAVIPCIAYTPFPYHHQQEIWYPNGMSYGVNSIYKSCLGVPFGEDMHCSNKVTIAYGIEAHSRYFGATEMSKWYQNAKNCNPNGRKVKQPIPNCVSHSRPVANVCEVTPI